MQTIGSFAFGMRWRAVLFQFDDPDASPDGLADDALRAFGTAVDGGWELPIVGSNTAILYTESWKLHVSVRRPESDDPGGRLILYQGDFDACLSESPTTRSPASMP
jgi:hypothetical protein